MVVPANFCHVFQTAPLPLGPSSMWSAGQGTSWNFTSTTPAAASAIFKNAGVLRSRWRLIDEVELQHLQSRLLRVVMLELYLLHRAQRTT